MGVGDRVKIETPDGTTHEGIIHSVTLDGIQLEGLNGADPMVVPTSSLSGIQIHRGQKRKTWQGLAIGVAGGVGLGVILGASAEVCDAEYGCPSRSENIGTGAFLGAALGLPIGVIVGSMFKGDRWEQGTLPSRLQIAPRGRGTVSVEISLTLPNW